MFNKESFCKKQFIFILLFLTLILPVAQIQCTYAQDTCIILASADAHSTITPSGNVSVAIGGSLTFSFSANVGYVISQVHFDNSVNMVGVAMGN